MNDSVRQAAEGHYFTALDAMAEGQPETALAADPTFTEAMHGLARALQNLERFDEAIVVALRITELDPDDVLAHTSLSVLYQNKDRKSTRLNSSHLGISYAVF